MPGDPYTLYATTTYTYDALGSLLSFRLNYPSTLIASGAFAPGGFLEGASYAGRASLNPAGAEGLGGMTYRGEAAGVFITGPGASSGELPGSVQAAGTVSGGAGMLTGAAYHGRGNIDPFGSFSGMTPYVYGEGLGAQSPREPYMGPTGSTQVDYTYGEGGAGPHAVTSLSDGSTFTYDANGNLASRYDAATGTNWCYAFDAGNRLTLVEELSAGNCTDGTVAATTAYVYDGEGRRVKRIVDDGATVTTTLYVAGMEIELVDGVEEHRTVYYGAGGAFRIIGGEEAGLYFRHTDHLGSAAVISDSGGLLVEGSDVAYAPFGEVRAGNLSELTDFGFTGQRLDRSTGGLMYYNARYYLPELRRFISPDTVVPGAGNPQNLNRYSYVRNNPVRYVDPSGHAIALDETGEIIFNPITRKQITTTPQPFVKLTLQEAQITAAEVQQAGSIGAYLRDEGEYDPALLMTRTAIGESSNPVDQEWILWIIRLYADLGMDNARFRQTGDPLDRWGAPTSIVRAIMGAEGTNPLRFEPIWAVAPLTVSPASLPGNLGSMLYPSADQMTDFNRVYRMASAILAGELSDMPGEIRGYDHFYAEGVGERPGTGSRWEYGGGLLAVQPGGIGGAVFYDDFPGDNVHHGLVDCQDVISKIPNYDLTGEGICISLFSCP